MSIVTVRPDGVAAWGGTWYNNGSYGPAPVSGNVGDAWDGTYLYGVEGNTWAEFNTGNYTLAENERCWHARAVARVESFNGSDPFNMDIWLKPMVAGDGGAFGISGPYGGPTTITGGWYGDEWDQNALNQFRIAARENHSGVTIARLFDLAIEFEILHRPEVSAISYNTNVRAPTVLWTYLDPDGRMGQTSWRVHVRRTDDNALVHDSGQVWNGGASHVLPAMGNGNYHLIVQVSNGNWGAWYSNWTYKSGGMTINAAPDAPTGVTRTGDPTDNTPNFWANIVGYVGYGVQSKARFEVYDSAGTTLIGTVDTPYIGGGGAATVEYANALALGSYKVRAQTIEQAGQVSAWTSMVNFQVQQAVAKDFNALWNVATPTVAVPKDFNALWNVIENKAKQLGLLWVTYESAVKDLNLVWNIATAWGDVEENETIWTRVIE